MPSPKYSDFTDHAVSKTPSTLKRDFGLDMSQFALGRLPRSSGDNDAPHAELEVSKAEFDTVLQILTQAVKRRLEIDGLSFSDGVDFCVTFDIEGGSHRDRSRATGRAAGEHRFLVRLARDGHAVTDMRVTLRRDPNGGLWINTLANPTSLLAGDNAAAVAIAGCGRSNELAALMRLPFVALETILQEIEPTFVWRRVTRERIERLLFRVGPMQLFTYLPIARDHRGRLLSFLRAALSSPLRHGTDRFARVHDLLGVRMYDHTAGDELETLLLVCRRDDRHVLSINFYEKDTELAAKSDWVDDLLATTDVSALTNALRLDLTLHEPALRDLMAAAGLGAAAKVAVTAANVVRAVQRLDGGEGRGSSTSCLDWLLAYTFEKRLPLRRLLAYRPSMIETACTALSRYHPRAAPVFRAWCRLSYDARRRAGRRQTFVSFAQAHPKLALSREQARQVRRQLLALDIDPDLPVEAYQTLYTQTYVWDLEHDERSALGRALEAGNDRATGKLMRQSRRASEQRITQITGVFDTMLAGAGTPAVPVSLRPHVRTQVRAGRAIPAPRVPAREARAF